MNKKASNSAIVVFSIVLAAIIVAVLVYFIAVKFVDSGYMSKKECVKINFAFEDGDVTCYKDGTIEATIERGSDKVGDVGLRFVINEEGAEDLKITQDFSSSEVPIAQGKKTLITKSIVDTGDSVTVRLAALVGKNTDVACPAIEEFYVTCDSCKHGGMCGSTQGCNKGSKQCGSCQISGECDDLNLFADFCDANTGICLKA